MVCVSRLKKVIRRDKTLTPFQKKVLLAVLDIPLGEVRTYGWVAQKIGLPLASRAVGNALSRNPYAPDVPCHRVVLSDGSIVGYFLGVKRKKKLLVNEGAGHVFQRHAGGR
jgi:methylated-DNA-[protein]-cysteine S-methyltransferase